MCERRGDEDETLGGKHGLKETRHTEASKHRHDWGNIRHICDTNHNSNLKRRNKNPTFDKWFLLFDNENTFLALLLCLLYRRLSDEFDSAPVLFRTGIRYVLAFVITKVFSSLTSLRGLLLLVIYK